MQIKKTKEQRAHAIKFTAEKDSVVIGRAYLYIMYNDLHEKPFGLIEDLFVEAGHRGQGIGTRLVRAVIQEAMEQGCYKLIGQSRYGREQAHELYEKLGFRDHGKNFRMDLDIESTD